MGPGAVAPPISFGATNAGDFAMIPMVGGRILGYPLKDPTIDPFYEAVEKVLRGNDFDKFVEELCEPFYAEKGRPSLAPGVYFRCLLIGFFEGIDSERGIAWRAADSMSLRNFLGLPLSKNPPDHSTISRTRRLLDLETHHRVFSWVLTVLAKKGLVKGKTVGVDSTTLEANAAMRSIVRREDGQAYADYLEELAKQSGVETPTREDIAKIDRKRKKKGSNDEWVHPEDPDADISKMKDGRTHLAHKHEHAVDMDTGAVLGVTLHGGTEADSETVEKTLTEARRASARPRKNSTTIRSRASANASARPCSIRATTRTRC